MRNMRKHQRGQSVFEYILILTAIVAVMVLAAGGPISTAITQMFNDSAQQVTGATQRLGNL